MALWIYGHYDYLILSAWGPSLDVRIWRLDVRFWRLKTVLTLKELGPKQLTRKRLWSGVAIFYYSLRRFWSGVYCMSIVVFIIILLRDKLTRILSQCAQHPVSIVFVNRTWPLTQLITRLITRLITHSAVLDRNKRVCVTLKFANRFGRVCVNQANGSALHCRSLRCQVWHYHDYGHCYLFLYKMLIPLSATTVV